jgi:hypothetical protein
MDSCIPKEEEEEEKSLKMVKNAPIFDGLLLLINISEVKNRIVSSKYNV